MKWGSNRYTYICSTWMLNRPRRSNGYSVYELDSGCTSVQSIIYIYINNERGGGIVQAKQ